MPVWESPPNCPIIDCGRLDRLWKACIGAWNMPISGCIADCRGAIMVDAIWPICSVDDPAPSVSNLAACPDCFSAS